jgi:hypothetical protein
MGWRAANGKPKDTVCRKALEVLNGGGIISLPQSDRTYITDGRAKPKPLSSIQADKITCELGELGDIGLEMVTNRSSKAFKIWKDLMDEHHYLGSGPLCGAQLRYLLSSSTYGYVGAMSFSSASWALRERDKYIGWTEGARRSNLQRIVCNSRFLIVPMLQVRNLASHVLSKSAVQISRDWMDSYGIEPVLLETFVDPRRFCGTSYRAANWVYVGQTSGRRGAQREDGGGPKDIYLYPLSQEWQQILCAQPQIGLGQRARLSETTDWAEEEFGTVELYDPRLRRRLFTVARDFYNQPQEAIPQVCGSHAKTKAAYRFFSNERVTMDVLLRAHTESTIERIQAQEVVLAVQDTTPLNYTTCQTTEGLGPINNAKDAAIGLLLHDTMAFNVDGTPLGLLDVQCWARDPEDRGKRYRRQDLPIEQKESMKWLRSYRAVAEVQKLCPQTMLVSVGDRESDIYELFLEATQAPQGPHLLVRCERSRKRKTTESNLWEEMGRLPVAGMRVVQIPRSGTRPAREAQLEVRFAQVKLKSPKAKKYPSVVVWMVHAREVDFDPEVKSPLEWMLLTTIAVNNFEQACQKLDWYTRRWGIEVYHKTIKSGCKVENRRFGTAEDLEACLAIDMVVAWRIYHLTKLGREVPDAPCTIFFEEAEWKALYMFVNKTPKPPEKEPSLRETIRMVASLGGFLGRKGDGEPGTTTIWRGLQRLEDITSSYLIFCPALESGP